MKKMFFLLFVIFFLAGCNSYDEYKIPNDVIINLNDNIFEVFDIHYTNELIKDSNVEIISKDILDTNEIGKHTYTLEFIFKNKKYKYIVHYDVKDSVSPVLISSPTYIPLYLGDDYSFCGNIAFGDNYDAYPQCHIEGEYDFNTIGKYNLEYVITDSSGNEAKEKFVLDVLNEVPKKNYNTPTYLYLDDILKLKNDNTSIGIDVSRWQGNIDFNKIKEQGFEFVIIRMGYPENNDDGYDLDMKFEEYYKQAKDAGLKISIYLYTEATNKASGIIAANFIIKTLNGDKVDLPIAYDFENWKNFNGYHTSLHDLSESYLAFEKTLNNHGYDAMLYSSKYYLENVWMNIDNSNIWLAQYTDYPTYQGKYMLWQMTDKAKIDGITDNTVDINILYKK